jgi:hypothetical protein
MTTLDSYSEISTDNAYGLSRQSEPRPQLPLMAIFHFCAVAGVALVSYLLVHH